MGAVVIEQVAIEQFRSGVSIQLVSPGYVNSFVSRDLNQ
jgi:hypothetical protein